jgi:HD-GYP domain-containing protein (c-di-GMP phosphodiesterase class II)
MSGNDSLQPDRGVVRILDIMKGVRELRTLDAILDRLLLEARRLVRADAGTIFLVEGDSLVFSYVHNDSLFSADDVTRYVYRDARLPIDASSLAGHAARHARPVIIDDAHALPPDGKLRFNASFDARAGYRTRAVATLPLIGQRGRVVAVLQLINPMTDSGAPRRFSPDDLAVLELLADQATAAIEAGLVTEEFILRMARMAEMRDAGETGAHVRRVGAYAAEISHALSAREGLPAREVKRRKDMIRLAAMLHDVGKVGITDEILGKPGPLSPDEFEAMKRHTLLGARLFSDPASEIDAAALEVALHHHQRFDGTGYPGRVGDPFTDTVSGNPPLAGTDIPLAARITALADVYDALVSRRVYKEPFSEEAALAILTRESGRHFDPRVVEAFFSIHDVILAIRQRYREHADADTR